MRTKLAPHLHRLVLVRGWIGGWKDYSSTNSRRVCIKQPTIKIADRSTLFANQQVISTEHHINLFIPHELLGQYEAHFVVHAPISFSGVVVEYRRRDGSIDYGISGTAQQRLQLDLERLSLALVDIATASLFRPSTLDYLKHTALPQVLALEERLEKAGNALPTFERTYEDYKRLLLDMRIKINIAIERIESLSNSRYCRRQRKGVSSFLKTIQSM